MHRRHHPSFDYNWILPANLLKEKNDECGKLKSQVEQLKVQEKGKKDVFRRPYDPFLHDIPGKDHESGINLRIEDEEDVRLQLRIGNEGELTSIQCTETSNEKSEGPVIGWPLKRSPGIHNESFEVSYRNKFISIAWLFRDGYVDIWDWNIGIEFRKFCQVWRGQSVWWWDWMCGVVLKDRRLGEDMYSLLGIQCVDNVVRRGRLGWFWSLSKELRWLGASLQIYGGDSLKCKGWGPGAERLGENVWVM